MYLQKLVFSLVVVSTLGMDASAQVRDHIRISFVGFNCNSETADNMMEMDGKGDEIFVQCNWIMAGKNNNTEFEGKYRSPMYGDVNGHYGWVQAGSRSDKGGIRSGDQYRGNYAIGEFDISDGEVLTIMPTIWEWDGNQDEINGFLSFLTGHVNEIRNASLQLVQGANQLSGGNTSQFLLDMGKTNMSLFSMAVQTVLGQAQDRPIGLDAAGRFKSKAFVLNRSLCRDVAQRNLGYGMGVLQMDYDENQLGNTRDHGAYTMLIKVEWLGTSSAAGTVPSNPTARYVPPPAANPAGNSGYIPPPVSNPNGRSGYIPPPVANPTGHGGYIPPPVANPAGRGGALGSGPGANQAGPEAAAVSIAGFWSGTYGDGPSSSSRGFFSLQFNTDGSLLMLAPNRAVLARGSYTLNGSVLNGSLAWLAGGKYMISGIVKRNTMSGTWGRETSDTNGGNWTLIKQ